MTRPDTADPQLKARAFHVGGWLVEPDWHRISANGRTRKIEPRVMRLLQVLAAEPGRVFTRDELLDAVWGELNVNEDALSRAVSQLRRAFADDSRNPEYIKTVHKSGYCLVAPVRPAGGKDAHPAAQAMGKRRFGLAAALAMLALFVFLAVRSLVGSGAPAEQAALVPLPVTSDPAREIDPSLSRDGERLAFGAQAGEGYDLFWRSIGEDRPRRLTRDGRFGGHPTWSPAGDRIAYVRVNGSRSSIEVVRLDRGAAETLLTLDGWIWGLDWSPDGRTLAFGAGNAGRPRGIVLLDVATRSRRTVTQAPSSEGDSKPAFSPDGRRIAFLRDGGLGLSRIFVLDLADPQAVRAVTREPDDIRGMDWDPAGRSLIFSAQEAGKFQLHRVGLSGDAAPRLIRTEGGDLFNPSISPAGRLAAEAVERDSDIWRAFARGTDPVAVVRSTFDDYDPSPSPDGQRVAFVSARSGAPELWVAGPDGADAARLTRLGGPSLGGPIWSPDARRLAFQARARGYAGAYVVDTARGRTLRVAQASGVHHVPIGWTADGNELLVAHGTGSSWQVSRYDLRSGRSSLLSSAPASLAAAAADGRSVYLLADDGTKLLRVGLEAGGTEAWRLPPSLGGASAMRSTPAGLFLMVPERAGTAVYRHVRGRGAGLTRVALVPGYGNVSVAADGRSFLFTRDRETSNDIVLIDIPKS